MYMLTYKASAVAAIAIKVFALVLIGCSIHLSAFAQQNETAAIKQTITTLFDGMRKADSAAVHTTFAKGMVLHSVSTKADGTTLLTDEKPADFLKAIGTLHAEVYDERLGAMDIKIDGPLASVWVPYKFYVGSKFSHCGIDVFQLMKTTAGWKVIYIVDTRRKDDCIE